MSTDVLRSLGWDDLKTRRCTTKLMLLYKVPNGSTGCNFKESLIWRSYNTRQTNYMVLDIYTTFKVIIPKHIIYDTSLREVWYAQHCFVYHLPQKRKINCMIRHFQALMCFYTRIFQICSSQDVIRQLSFHLWNGKKLKRIPEEKVFVARELSKGMTTLTIAKRTDNNCQSR